MRWNLGALIVAGAIELGILAMRAAQALGGSTSSAMFALRDRFAGLSDQTATAVITRIEQSYQSGVSYNRLRNPEATPTVPPVDLRPALSREYGAPPPNPETGTNTRYTYVVDVTTNQERTDGKGYQTFPVTVTSSSLLSNGELDTLAAERLSDFLNMLVDVYGRDGDMKEASATGTRVISATLGYDFPAGWIV